MRQFVALLAGSALTAASLYAPSVDAREVQPLDMPSGKQTRAVECPPNEALVGLGGRFGPKLESLELYCAQLLPDGTFGEPHNLGNFYGGSGGASIGPAICPRDTVIRRIYRFFGMFDSVVLDCVRNGEDGVHWFLGKNTEMRPRGRYSDMAPSRSCNGTYFVGLSISFLPAVYGIAPICDSITPTPKVLRSTGKARPSGPQVAPVQAFQGGWETVTDQNGHYTLILQIANSGQDPLLFDTYVTGQFINTDGATQYNGVLQGTIPRGTRTLHYNYGQPEVNAGGQGQFTLSNDGNAITGNGTGGGQTFTWNGTRAK